MKTFKFSLVLRTRENIDVFISLDDNIYGIHSKRVSFLFIFFVYMPMRVSGVITNVTKQNMNVMASTFSA